MPHSPSVSGIATPHHPPWRWVSKERGAAGNVGSVVATPAIGRRNDIDIRSRRRRILIAVFSAVPIAACRPLVMTPEARSVAVAREASEVGPCKLKGEVFALAPFRDVAEPLDQLKMRAHGIGADTVLVSEKEKKSAQTDDWQAKAYRCREKVAAAKPPADESVSR